MIPVSFLLQSVTVGYGSTGEITTMIISLLRSIVHSGSLRVIDAGGHIRMLGDGTPPSITIRLRTRRIAYSMALNPGLVIGEAYMDGLLVVEEGSVYDFLEMLARNYTPGNGLGWLDRRWPTSPDGRSSPAPTNSPRPGRWTAGSSRSRDGGTTAGTTAGATPSREPRNGPAEKGPPRPPPLASSRLAPARRPQAARTPLRGPAWRHGL